MLTQDIIKSFSQILTNMFEADSSIKTIACIQIDGPIFYLRDREVGFKKNINSMNQARLSALSLLIKNLSSHLLTLNGDTEAKYISFRNLEKQICLSVLDFFMVFVETISSGNAKGIAKKISGMSH